MASDEEITSSFVKLRGHLARAVLSIVPPKEIEDIVQETYVRACQMRNKAQIREPGSYLFRIARNLALDYVKKADVRLTVTVDDLTSLIDERAEYSIDQTLDTVATREEFSLFCEAVRALPVQRRRAVVLKRVYGYSRQEVAEEMNISKKTVDRHIALGMADCIGYVKRRLASSPAGNRVDIKTSIAPMRVVKKGSGHE
jgi:RNA polymerase sigma factor (sigma-70 family)